MIIDRILLALWNFILHYVEIAKRAPSEFEYHHWIIFSVVCLVIGGLCMRGFGSRKDY